MAEPVAPLKPGEKRAACGTVAWLVADYLASLDFLGRPKSVRDEHRMYCDRFRAKRWNLPVARVEQEYFEKLLAKMIDRPATAKVWLVATCDLFNYPIKRKLLVVNPATEIAKRSSGNSNDRHTWTPEQVEQFRRRHPIVGKTRLALELINALAFRRSDVIRLGGPDLRVLKYTQHKMREHTPSHVEVPMPADLTAIIRQTPGTGIRTWLVDGHGKPDTDATFSHWFADRCDEAGLPRKTRPSGEVVRLCTPHGFGSCASPTLPTPARPSIRSWPSPAI